MIPMNPDAITQSWSPSTADTSTPIAAPTENTDVHTTFFRAFRFNRFIAVSSYLGECAPLVGRGGHATQRLGQRLPSVLFCRQRPVAQLLLQGLSPLRITLRLLLRLIHFSCCPFVFLIAQDYHTYLQNARKWLEKGYLLRDAIKERKASSSLSALFR